jgi:hemolysin D
VDALAQSLRTGQPPGAAGSEWSAADRALLQAEWADIAGRLARLEAEQARRRAEIATLGEVVAKIEATLPLVRRREADFKTLSDEGMVPVHASQDRARERIEIERDLATQRARLSEAEAALDESRRARAAALAEIERTLALRAARARLELAQLEQQGSKSAQRAQLTRLTSPVAGTVQQLAVHTAGGVVTPAQALMVVVPDGGDVTAEVAIDNRDIGFVREGQSVEVKLETFAFTRYGTVPATVTRVSADAAPDDRRGAVFPATLAFARSSIEVDGRSVRLSPGMNVTAEIKTGQQRVIEFLTSPVRRTVSESLRER